MHFRFSKMHGLGNDFMVVDGVTQKVFFSHDLIKRLGDRHTGVGFDQMLLVEPPYDPEQDFHYRIFNQDGSEVQMCGNGARCFARFVVDKGLCNKRDIKVSTVSGELNLKLDDNGIVSVNMGIPVLEPSRIPFQADVQAPSYTLEVSVAADDVRELEIGAVSMGNPHAVYLVDDIQNCDFEKLGPVLEQHPRFPEKVNVGFMQVVSRNEIKLRVFERGCGETLACGSGSCAAVVSGIYRGLLDNDVTVCLPLGSLHIHWDGKGQPVIMKGPVTHVFDGEMDI